MEDMKKRYQAYAAAVKEAADKNASGNAADAGAAAEKTGKRSIIARLQKSR